MQLKAKLLIYSACKGKGCRSLHLRRLFRFSEKLKDACTYSCTCDLPSQYTLTPYAIPNCRRSKTNFDRLGPLESVGCWLCSYRDSISADLPNGAYSAAPDRYS